MKNQVRKQFLKDIREHARDFIKNLRAKNKFKRVAYKRLKGEIIRYLQKKQQDKINNELKKLRLAKLANNNVSKSDLVNIKRFNAFPIKHLRQIAKLRNISTNLSKSDIIIIMLMRYLAKLMMLDCYFQLYLLILTKRNVIVLERDCMKLKILEVSTESLKIDC